ncbi:manganese superoxide dismutase 1 [Striga asiatica]|uniref:Manganese superoxide dismutase 1 n=1 Tax=Striga asiatica TaxID=4170 RepID=A0A5A7Q5C9_STRAF|nr:manganese superoxide dismutase 1 [Striga asiatica]
MEQQQIRSCVRSRGLLPIRGTAAVQASLASPSFPGSSSPVVRQRSADVSQTATSSRVRTLGLCLPSSELAGSALVTLWALTAHLGSTTGLVVETARTGALVAETAQVWHAVARAARVCCVVAPRLCAWRDLGRLRPRARTLEHGTSSTGHAGLARRSLVSLAGRAGKRGSCW